MGFFRRNNFYCLKTVIARKSIIRKTGTYWKVQKRENNSKVRILASKAMIYYGIITRNYKQPYHQDFPMQQRLRSPTGRSTGTSCFFAFFSVSLSLPAGENLCYKLMLLVVKLLLIVYHVDNTICNYNNSVEMRWSFGSYSSTLREMSCTYRTPNNLTYCDIFRVQVKPLPFAVAEEGNQITLFTTLLW